MSKRLTARDQRQLANYEAELLAEEHAARQRYLDAVPLGRRQALLSAPLAALKAEATWWESQPMGAIELANLIDNAERIIGDTGRPLVDLTSLGDEGAEVAKRMHMWLAPEDSAAYLGEQFELILPEPGRANVTPEGVGERLEDGRVWRRNFVRRHLRACESQHVAAGLVGRGRETIISHDTRRILTTRWKHQAQALREAVAMSDAGDEVALFELVQSSVANHRVRFAELATRVRGFEAIADDLGHAAVFVTLTCPSRFHPTKSLAIKRKKGGRAYRTVQNPAWVEDDQPNAKDANNYLCSVWSRTRSAAARRGLRVYGLRVTEPHADGCPHWHMMLWGEPHALGQFTTLFNAYACQSDAPELEGKVWTRQDNVWRKVPGATVRFDVKLLHAGTIGPDGKRKGGAAAYLLKYLTKNLDGLIEEKRDDGEHKALGDDFEAETDTATGAEKARAWASVWGIRQFQFYGGPPVGVWRELRRLRGAGQESPWIDYAVQAADAGDWALFCKLMGGPLVARRDMPLALAKAERPGETNRYGEEAGAVVKGVQSVDDATAITKTKRWKIEWRPKRRQEDSAAGRNTGMAEGRAARAGRSPDPLGLVPITVRTTPESDREPPTLPPPDTEFDAMSGPPPWAFSAPDWLDQSPDLRRYA